MSTPTREYLTDLEKKRDGLAQRATELLESRRAAGVEELDHADSIRFRAMSKDLRSLDQHIRHYASELARVGTYPGNLARPRWRPRSSNPPPDGPSPR